MKLNTMKVSKAAYMYLRNRMRLERTGAPFTEKGLASVEKNFDKFAHKGFKELYDGDLGGASEYGWTSWSCKDMAAMLDEQGLDYIMGEEKEQINL